MKTIEECQGWLEERLTTPSERPTIEEFKKQINKNNLLSENPKVILIAGTNGKGTTAILLECILQTAGYRTGSFISPHLYSINERIRVNGASIEPQLFCYHFNRVAKLYDHKKTHWFGFLLLIALDVFQEFVLDFLIIEVGIGGKTDLTNALEPDVSVITTIAMDHMDILGYDREQIGVQKAGVFRANKPAICGDFAPPNSVLQYAKEISADLSVQAKDFHYQLQTGTWDWYGFGHEFTNLPQPKMPLQNASTALATLMALQDIVKLNAQIIHKALVNVFIPGRYQCIATHPTVICDVAHNPQSVAWVATKLANDDCQGKTIAIVAMKPNKMITDTLTAMSIPIAAWFLADLEKDEGFIQQAAPFLQTQLGEVYIADSVILAFKKAKAIATENDRIIVFGSFKTVRQIFSLFPQARYNIK